MMRRLATKNAFFPQTDLHGRKFGFDMYSQVVADFLLWFNCYIFLNHFELPYPRFLQTSSQLVQGCCTARWAKPVCHWFTLRICPSLTRRGRLWTSNAACGRSTSPSGCGTSSPLTPMLRSLRNRTGVVLEIWPTESNLRMLVCLCMFVPLQCFIISPACLRRCSFCFKHVLSTFESSQIATETRLTMGSQEPTEKAASKPEAEPQEEDPGRRFWLNRLLG